MSNPVDHHTVPKLLQRNFADSDGRLFYFDKSRPRHGVGKASPRSLFVTPHMYSVFNEAGMPDSALEGETSKLETQAAAIIKKMMVAVRANRAPILSPSERSVWYEFFHLQWKRVPELFGWLAKAESPDEMIDRIVEEFEVNVRPMTDVERAKVRDREYRDRVIHNGIAQVAISRSERIIEVLAARGIGVARVAVKNKAFIIGSSPMIKFNHPGRPHPLDPSVEIWLPVASDVVVGLGHGPDREVFVPITDATHIRHINEAISAQSQVIAGHSQKLIASLACTDWRPAVTES